MSPEDGPPVGGSVRGPAGGVDEPAGDAGTELPPAVGTGPDEPGPLGVAVVAGAVLGAVSGTVEGVVVVVVLLTGTVQKYPPEIRPRSSPSFVKTAFTSICPQMYRKERVTGPVLPAGICPDRSSVSGTPEELTPTCERTRSGTANGTAAFSVKVTEPVPSGRSVETAVTVREPAGIVYVRAFAHV
jgi:hypothetical protein